jgi:acetyl esterase/lipase
MQTIAYVDGPGADPIKHSLDLYRPKGGSRLPMLLYFHGGVWQRGDKGQYRNIGEAFARRGVLTAIVNYRLTPAVRHPGHVRDAARAVAWSIRHAAQYGGRPDRVYLSGHSAGGHRVTLLLFDPQYLRAEGTEPDTIAGVIALSGVFDLTTGLDDTSDGGAPGYIHLPFGSDPAVLADASPIRRIRTTAVPLLVILAGEDYQAMQRQSQAFAGAARRRGLSVSFETIAGRSHYALVQSIGQPDDRTTDLIAAFTCAAASSTPRCDRRS